MKESKERSQSRLFVPMSEDIESYRLRPLAKIIYGNPFELTIVALILANAVILAFLTLPDLEPNTVALLARLDVLIYAIFVVEILLRIISYGKKPWLFFTSRWNVFDFVVVAVVALATGTGILLRLLRLLRVIRLFRFMPEFQMLSIALARTVKPLLSAFLLISLFVFFYGMVGVYIFGESNPEYWGDITVAFVTLTVLLTLENFPEVLEAGLAATPLAWIYLVSFMVIVVFTVLNVLIGIVLNAMDEVRKESQDSEPPADDMSEAIDKLALAARGGLLGGEHKKALKKIMDAIT